MILDTITLKSVNLCEKNQKIIHIKRVLKIKEKKSFSTFHSTLLLLPYKKLKLKGKK